MKIEQSTDLRVAMLELCEQFDLGYIIMGGRIEPTEENQEERSVLYFEAPEFAEKKLDLLNRYKWLRKAGIDFSTFANNQCDELEAKHQMVSIPLEDLKRLNQQAQQFQVLNKQLVGEVATEDGSESGLPAPNLTLVKEEAETPVKPARKKKRITKKKTS